MAATIYIVKLSPDERNALTKIIAEGKESDRTIMRARILSTFDTGQTNTNRSWAQDLLFKNLRKNERAIIYDHPLELYEVVDETPKAYKLRITDAVWCAPSKNKWFTPCEEPIDIWMPKKACILEDK